MPDEPVNEAAAIFVTATRKFPMTAAQTVVLVADRATVFPGAFVPPNYRGLFSVICRIARR
jgi:hypothetical protein